MTYQFGLEQLSIPQQVQLLKELEIDGLILEIDNNTLHRLNEYYVTDEVLTGDFHIYDIFTNINLDNQVQFNSQLNTIEKIYSSIQCNETELQVLFHGNTTQNHAIDAISKISTIAKKHNKNLIIYPHAGLFIESAEEALSYIEVVNQNNIYLSLHLCHELAAGNGNRINEVIENVMPYIKSVSISGASEEELNNTTLPLWYWGIKPLSMGTYNYTSFYQKLIAKEYKGTIAIHSWGVSENFNLNPADHLPNSKNILLDISDNSCE